MVTKTEFGRLEMQVQKLKSSFYSMLLVNILFFIWAISITAICYYLILGKQAEVKSWDSQVKINKKFDGFIGTQKEFNQAVDDKVLVNLQ